MGTKSHSDVRTGYPLGEMTAFRTSFHTVVASRIRETEINAGHRKGEKEFKVKSKQNRGSPMGLQRNCAAREEGTTHPSDVPVLRLEQEKLQGNVELFVPFAF